jgi:hypothetical protein
VKVSNLIEVGKSTSWVTPDRAEEKYRKRLERPNSGTPMATADRERSGEVDHRPRSTGGSHGRVCLPAPAAHLPGAGHSQGDPRRAAAEGAEAG